MATDADTLKIGHGQSIKRLPGIDDETWAKLTREVAATPTIWAGLQRFAEKPDAMYGFLQVLDIAEHYHAPVQMQIRALGSRLRFGELLSDLKGSPIAAVWKYVDDEDLMTEVCSCLGGAPGLQQFAKDVKPEDRAMLGLKVVQDHLARKKTAGVEDHGNKMGDVSSGAAAKRRKIMIASQMARVAEIQARAQRSHDNIRASHSTLEDMSDDLTKMLELVGDLVEEVGNVRQELVEVSRQMNADGAATSAADGDVQEGEEPAGTDVDEEGEEPAGTDVEDDGSSNEGDAEEESQSEGHGM